MVRTVYVKLCVCTPKGPPSVISWAADYALVIKNKYHMVQSVDWTPWNQRGAQRDCSADSTPPASFPRLNAEPESTDDSTVLIK